MTIGKGSEQQIRTGWRWAPTAVLVRRGRTWTPLRWEGAAKVVKAKARPRPDGEACVDDDNNQVGRSSRGPRWRSDFASKIDFPRTTGRHVTRRWTVGLETIEVTLPAVVPRICG